MPEKGQTMRFTNSELSLIKVLFAENEPLLFVIRKSILGFKLNENEENLVKGLSKETTTLLRKAFLPDLDPSSPLFQLTDMVMGLNVDMKGQTQEFSIPMIAAKSIEIQYMEEAMDILEGKDVKHEHTLQSLANLKDENAFVNVTARNYLLSYIDSNCKQLEFLAGTKEETVEETISRLQKNSNK